MVMGLVACGGDRVAADLIRRPGGTVWTGVAGRAPAEALAVRSGRIVAVGRSLEVESYRGPQTREIELEGRLVVPGLSDGHTHFIAGRDPAGKRGSAGRAIAGGVRRRIGAFARGTEPAGRWITGGDWDHELWPGGPLPRREWIDSVTGAHPVSVNRLDGHMVLVNIAGAGAGGCDAGTRRTRRVARSSGTR